MSQTLYYLDCNGILQPGSQVTALIADVERLRAELAEAEALLRESHNKIGTEDDGDYAILDKIDAWLARRGET